MYRYYSIMRPVSKGTYPSNYRITFENFDSRKWCGEIQHYAWGFFETDMPLTESEVWAYELIPMRKEFTVKLYLSPEQEEKLREMVMRNNVGMSLEDQLQYLVDQKGKDVLEVIL